MTEQILITLYSLPHHEKFVSRRDIATVIFICNNLLDVTEPSTYDIFPDGIESEKVNLYIDYLLVKNLVDIQEGIVLLTNLGKKMAKELLMNPDNKDIRIFFRAAREIWQLKKDARISLATYLYFLQFNAELKGFSKVKALYKELKDYLSIFVSTETQKVTKKEKIVE